MHHKRLPNAFFGASLRHDSPALAILVLLLFLFLIFLLLTLTAQPAQAQTYQVIHNFTGGGDGKNPCAGLTLDTSGNFYGTTFGTPCVTTYSNAGTVFSLSKKSSGWLLTPLHNFRGGNDGAGPWSRVVIGPDGSLYGTTAEGGEGCSGPGCGTVFNLRPPSHAPPNVVGGWTETVLYRFSGGSDGAGPGLGDFIFDQAGHIYGTTVGGGAYMWGTVFKMTPFNGDWTESVLYSFPWSGTDGGWPFSGVIFDSSGNLYGTTGLGGNCHEAGGCGTVFQLTPSGSGWTEHVLYNFPEYGSPLGGLIFDNSGSLYGTASDGDSGECGTVFELSGRNWAFAELFSFSGGRPGQNSGPYASLVVDAAGNLYGTTFADGTYGQGSVFKLTSSYGGWTYTSLHDFTGGSDGGSPWSNVTFDANGNLYGTASSGGTGTACSGGCGVVWEITP